MKKILLLVLCIVNLTSCGLFDAGTQTNTETQVTEPTTDNESTVVSSKETEVESSSKAINYFTEDMAALKKKAVLEDKKIILFFGATWCSPCKKYKDETFLETETNAYLKAHYIVKYMDVETDFDGIELQQKYNIQLLPTLLFFSENFKELDQVQGHLAGHTFYKRIKAVNEGV